MMVKNRFSKFIIGVMSSTLLLLAILFFVSSQPHLREASVSIPSFILNQMSSLVRKPLAAVEALRQEAEDLLRTYQENQDLKKHLLTLDNQKDLLRRLGDENERLRQALDIKTTYKESPFIATEVLVRSSVAWLEEITVDKGRQHGVSKGMLLVSKEGLLGYPVVLGSDTTKVQLLTNTVASSAIPVVIQGKNPIYGIFMGYDTAKGALKISQLNSQEDIAVNSAVVTSGLDGETPAGVTLGRVLEVDYTAQSRIVYVSMAANPSHLTAVSFIGRQ